MPPILLFVITSLALFCSSCAMVSGGADIRTEEVTYTAGGATCTAGPFVTHINDTVNLPAGSSVTYTSVCSVDGGASGSLVNTATVSASGGVTDPVSGNNSASDRIAGLTVGDRAFKCAGHSVLGQR